MTSDQKQQLYVLLPILISLILINYRGSYPQVETSWIWDYQFGLIKRGLIGSLLGSWVPISSKTVSAISLLVIVSSSLVYLYLLVQVFVTEQNSAFRLTMILWLATIPGFIPQHTMSGGILDLWAIPFAVIHILCTYKGWHRRVFYPEIQLVSLIFCVLIHEASVFFLGTLFFASALLDQPTLKDILRSRVTYYVFLSFIFSITLSKFTLLNYISMPDAINYYHSVAPKVEIDEMSMKVQFTSLDENKSMGLDAMRGSGFWFYVLLYLPAFMPFYLLFFNAARTFKQQPLMPIALIITFLVPLSLSIVATDVDRWLSMSNLALALLTVLIYARGKLEKTFNANAFQYAVLFTLVYQCLIFSINSSFQTVLKLQNLLSSL
ncbi:hypothetical protein [Methylomonas sp. AM2-LC]|uniref:hypothetical protein n=1 Tax=Methylomonas sp. AM2-LC TaxID=3153301 RepID=UPI003265A750